MMTEADKKYMEGFDLIDKVLGERETLEEWLEERKQFLRKKIKRWPPDSSVHKCGQARLHEIKTIQLKFFNDDERS